MRLPLNKNSLKQQRDQLTMYRRFLPSLELKRQQLLSAWKSARNDLAEQEREIAGTRDSLQSVLPLLGSTTLQRTNLSELVHVRAASIGEENVLGTRVPIVREVTIERTPYSTLALPFWVDQLVDALEQLAKQQIHLQVQDERTERLRIASQKITQRVNLFEKVLIPRAEENIKQIRVTLEDEERAAVVRSKLAKQKRA